MIDRVRTNNPDKQIITTDHPDFREFGTAYTGLDVTELIDMSLRLFHEEQKTLYVASEPALESLPQTDTIRTLVFGQMPIQVGCCYGMNTRLNGMEYHKTSEFIIAATDLLLMLGRIQDIDSEGRWDSSRTVFLYLGRGEAVELYATTLHLAPCRVSQSPFNALILLPRGTNTPLSGEPEGSLWRKNKWLLAHENGSAAGMGAVVGIIGENLSVNC